MKILKYTIILSLILFLVYCTTNPFSKDEDTKSNTQIVSGKIILSDGSYPDSIYVWLEEFDIGVFTNGSGEFRLSLPPQQEQPGGGVTGVFNLYFFVVNYELEFVEVSVNNGLFIYNNGAIDKNGSLKDVITLQKLLNVKTEVSPQHIPADFRSYIFVTITLESIENPAKISAIISDNNVISGVFIRNISKKNEFLNQYFMTNSRIQTVYVPTIASSSVSYYRYETCEYPKGEYEVIPFIWVEQNNIPVDLIDNFTSYPVSMSPDFLKLPFKRKNAIINVEYCEHRIGDDP